ncbi:MAG: 3-deoxy-7-phosphoheptulonate synthase [Clostridiales bacterium]|jgi:3-deoxy-7-phosphoheptulonate synthase|nr:3-deoxy-7-phosphoheptulonate synthase [Clostridiales bacterium]
MFTYVKKIISPEEARRLAGLSPALKKRKEERDAVIRDIIAGRDARLLLIVGPCSADNETSVLDYVARLSKLADAVRDKLFIVPRIYTNKPRSRGEGYKGMLHNPDRHSDSTDIQAGILALRRLHIRAIEESGLSAADEMLYPDNAPYIEDILSYISVGARSSENQQHRLVASGFEVAVGVKNPMNGSLPVLLNSIYAAQIPNEFKYGADQVRTGGNPYAHAVLRGSVDVYGNNLPNYHYEDLVRLFEMYGREELHNPAVIIDANHSNSGKNPFEQVRIVKEVEGIRRHTPALGRFVKGYLIESYIEDGAQGMDGGVYGKSVTDACLGWEKTERLIQEVADRI